jgi:hypothetical protein
MGLAMFQFFMWVRKCNFFGKSESGFSGLMDKEDFVTLGGKILAD